MRSKRSSQIIVCSIFCVVVLGAVRLGISLAADQQSKNIDQKLLKAVQDGDLDGVRRAIRQGANVKATTEFGETALHLVSNVKIAEVLIRAGANLNARDRDFEMTPLFNADLKTTRLLIEKGAQVNVRAKKGMTPLSWAVYWDQKEKVKLLIAKGADLNAVDDDGKSPLHIAANWGKMTVVRFLISKGANVNIRDTACWTPLHWAAMEGTAEVIDLLISAGADCNAASCQSDGLVPSGATPLDIAKKLRTPDLCTYLESRGCKSGIPPISTFPR
jgi:ankyrin repeat protein